MTQNPPNILFLQTDQLSPFVLRAYGDTICQSPAIDRLAANGLVFENAYCNFPLCAPSRFSMASGQLASRIGAFDNAAEFPASIPTYAHYLRALGYQTCLSGKMHFVGPDQLHGFEKRLTSDIYPADFEWTANWEATEFGGATDIRMLTNSGPCARSVQIDYDEEVAHRAIGELYALARTSDKRPFFLQVSFTHPHDPYLCTPDMWDRYDDASIPMPHTGRIRDEDNDAHSLRLLRQHGLAEAEISEEIIRRARRAYYGSVSYIDDKIAQVLAALQACGFDDNTIVVFCSDHGEMLGERGLWLKKNFFEQSLRVPLIVFDPRRPQSGRVSHLCSLVDLLPTFLSFASEGKWSDPVDPLDGIDLNGLRGHDGEPGSQRVYAELLSEGVPAPTFMIRERQYKFVANGVDPDLLFDLDADPHEIHNRANDPDLASLRDGFRRDVAIKWNRDALTTQILQSQKRRLFIRNAMKSGVQAVWDFDPDGVSDGNWFRAQSNYNDWAFEYLPVKGEPDGVGRL